MDEDLSPKISKILRAYGVDAVSAHETGLLRASDLEQLEFACSQKRCLVTRNRGDFIRLTVQFFNESRSHYGVLIVPYTYPSDNFRAIASALRKYSESREGPLESYAIDFL